MGSEIKKEVLSCCEEKEKIKCEKVIETELNLPDYCTDIKRILKCTLTPGIHSVSTTGDRVNIKGTAVIRLIYAGEKEKIDCCEKTVDLSLSGQLKQADGKAVTIADALTDYVNCRAVSQRKISVNGSVSVICRVLGERKTEIPCEADSAIQTKKEKQTQETLVCQGEKTFDLSETVALDKGKASIGKILRQYAHINIESQKAVDDKLLIKGEMVVKAVYCPPETENKLESLIHTMPVSQIIDIEGMDDRCDIRTDCRVSQLLLCVKSDSSEAGRLLEIAARVSCHITACKVKEYEYISDCYCTENRHIAEFAAREVPVPVYSAEKLLNLKENTEIASAKEICDVWIGESTAYMSGSEDKAQGKIGLTVCFLYLDEKGAPAYKEKELEFQSDIALKENYGELKCDFSVESREVKAYLEKDGAVEVSADVMAKIRIYSLWQTEYVCDIKENGDGSQITDKPALTLYYSQKGEKIWDIAKKYSTTVSAVKEENGIEGDAVPKDKMLLIPCV